MRIQNPIFIPSPTNILEALRKAVDMPIIDRRSPLFGEILRPALAGAKEALKSAHAEILPAPRLWRSRRRPGFEEESYDDAFRRPPA